MAFELTGLEILKNNYPCIAQHCYYCHLFTNKRMGICYSQTSSLNLMGNSALETLLTESRLSSRDASRLLEIFRFIDHVDRDGLISSQDFFRFIGLSRTILNERMFHIIDCDYKKNITFEQFVRGLIRLCTMDDFTITQVHISL